MSKMHKIWAESHPVKSGQVIPEGTEFIAADTIDGIEVSDLTVAVAAVDIEVSGHSEVYLRTLEPLPDTDDTGDVDFYVYTQGKSAHTVDIVDVPVTRNQARNFARKLLEALDE